MKGYNLMQAIARVNRVFKDKEGGLVVDYVGIASALKEAMMIIHQEIRKIMVILTLQKLHIPNFLKNFLYVKISSMVITILNLCQVLIWKDQEQSVEE